MAIGVKYAASSRTSVVAVGDLRGGAAHDAGDADRRVLGVADEAVLAGVPRPRPGTPSVRVDAVEGLDRLARTGPTHRQPAPGQPRQVVGVGGLAQLEHDVVGGVDHVVDRPHPGQRQAPGHPLRRGADASRRAARPPSAGGRGRATPPTAEAADSTGRPLGRRSGGSGGGERQPSRAARSRAIPAMHQASGRLPSTVMSKTMSGTRPSASVSGVPGLARRLVAQDQQAGPSSERPSSLPEHSMPLEVDAPHLAPADLEAAGQHGADRGQRDPVAHREVVGAADDLERVRRRHRPRPGGSCRRLRWRRSRAPGDHDVVQALAHLLDRLDHQAQIVERGAQRPVSSGNGAKSRSQLSGARTVVEGSFSGGWPVRTATGSGCRSP